MHITELLKIKLKENLVSELNKLYDSEVIPHNKRIYDKLCLKKINHKIKNVDFLTKKVKNRSDDNTRCCARIWDNHYGSRCNYKQHLSGDYCKHHLNMITKNGKLLFNRYDEEKPIYNDKNNKIPWIDIPEIEVINKILLKQWLSLEKKINIELKKQRYIAPKI